MTIQITTIDNSTGVIVYEVIVVKHLKWKNMENTRDNKARFLLISYANNRNSIKHIHGAGVVFSAIDIINNPDEFY